MFIRTLLVWLIGLPVTIFLFVVVMLSLIFDRSGKGPRHFCQGVALQDKAIWMKRKVYLDKLYTTSDIASLSPDPLEFVHEFKKPEDREVVGLIASSLAYGRVERILASIRNVLERMDNQPYRFVVNFNPRKDAKVFDGFIHRFNNGRDIACLVYFAK